MQLRNIKFWVKQTRSFLIEIYKYRNIYNLSFHQKIDYARYSWLTKCLREQTGRANSPFYAYHIYSEMVALLREYNFKPTRVLELGTGSSLGSLFCFALSGVERAVGIDIHPIDKDNLAFYELLKGYVASVGGQKWWRYYVTADERPYCQYPSNMDNIDVSKILENVEYLSPVQSHELPFSSDSFDFTYSIAAMEHFEKAGDTVSEIKRVSVPGALTIHEIDFSHHGSAEPLHFLEWSESEYSTMKVKKYASEEGHGIDDIIYGSWTEEVYCNRLRLSDFLQILKNQDFDVLKVEPVRLLDSSRIDVKRLDKKFQHKEISDLQVLAARVVAKVTK